MSQYFFFYQLCLQDVKAFVKDELILIHPTSLHCGKTSMIRSSLG